MNKDIILLREYANQNDILKCPECDDFSHVGDRRFWVVDHAAQWPDQSYRCIKCYFKYTDKKRSA